jgi:hypothetical protein
MMHVVDYCNKIVWQTLPSSDQSEFKSSAWLVKAPPGVQLMFWVVAAVAAPFCDACGSLCGSSGLLQRSARLAESLLLPAHLPSDSFSIDLWVSAVSCHLSNGGV